MTTGMIDLHSHILPGIDDGSPDLQTSIQMARHWVEDGVSIVACTPHILPGLYHNDGPQIREAISELQLRLDEHGIPLTLVSGADNHIVPDFTAGLKSGRLLSLHDTRYVLVEPPHHNAPSRLGDVFFDIMAAGYRPILTHPERLTWIKTHYELIRLLAFRGVWMQITAGALTGAFGRGPKYWGERMLDEGLVHIIATDSHDLGRRPPILSQGYERSALIVGEEEAWRLVHSRPLAILENRSPSEIPQPVALGEITDKGKSEHAGRRHKDTFSPYGDNSSRTSRSGFFGWVQQLFTE